MAQEIQNAVFAHTQWLLEENVRHSEQSEESLCVEGLRGLEVEGLDGNTSRHAELDSASRGLANKNYMYSFSFFDIDAKKENESKERNTLFTAWRAQAEPSLKGNRINSHAESINNQNKKAAFTLAETLITIGIIGVVAAMVIPVTIQKVQDYVFGKAKENSLMKITEATKEMKSNDVLSGYTSNSAFASKFAEYMTVVKRCDSTNLDGCFASSIKNSEGKSYNIGSYTIGTKLDKNNLSDGTIAMMLKNGTTMLFSLKDSLKDPAGCARIDPFSNTANTTGCMSFLYDVNGRGGPNTIGKDIGSISVTGFSCGGIKTSDGTCFAGAFKPTPMTYANCLSSVSANTYGIKACGYISDYWAGAVATCGGVAKMPTQEQLANLANYLLGVTGCSGSEYPNFANMPCRGTLNYEKAASIGLPSSGSFSIFSGVENTGTGAYSRYLDATSGIRNDKASRGGASLYSICLE